MDQTPNIGMPYIMPSQAQKHVTHNESLGLLDAVVQLCVVDRDLASPPASPSEGDRYIVAPSPTGAWAGKQDQVAFRLDGAWVFLAPRPGWLAWLADESELVYWTGVAWQTVASTIEVLQNLALLGLGTTADAANPFAAKLNKALWTAKTSAEGGDGDLRYTLNKETAGDVLSFLLQTGFSGRAELGLVGDDDVTLKVSPDGSAWTTALQVDKTTGLATLAADPAAALGIATKQYADVKVAKAGDYMSGALNMFGGANTVPSIVIGGANGIGSGYGSILIANTAQSLVTAQVFLAHNSTTSAILEVASDAGNGTVRCARYTTNATGTSNNLYKSRGTRASPLPVVQNDVIGDYMCSANAGTGTANFVSCIGIRGTVIEATPSASAMAGRITALACAAGSATVTEILRLDHATGLSMFGANPVIDENRLHRQRSYTVATLPAAGVAGRTAFASNCRVFNGAGTQEGSGAGTGSLVVDNGTAWKIAGTNITAIA